LCEGISTIINQAESESTYEQASTEFSMKQLINSDPIHEAVAKLESKHQKVINLNGFKIHYRQEKRNVS